MDVRVNAVLNNFRHCKEITEQYFKVLIIKRKLLFIKFGKMELYVLID